MRRKHKAAHKTSGGDDKKLQAVLKRFQIQLLPTVEEVNMFKDDNTVLHFTAPRVHASTTYNTYVVTGAGESKTVQELLPGILSQMGGDSLSMLKRMAESYQTAGGAPGAAGFEDEDLPDLVGNFEEASK